MKRQRSRYRAQLVRALVALVALVALQPVAAQADIGSLVPDFGDGGLVHENFGIGPSASTAIAQMPDGKLVAAGLSSYGSGFLVARYQANGALDPGFGDGGRQMTTFGRGIEAARAVLAEPDGKSIVVGSNYSDVVMARYTTSGALDPTFSGDGEQITTPGGQVDIYGAALQPDGKIVVVGDGSQNFVYGWFVARYDADGQLDPSFGQSGSVVIGASQSGARAVAIQSDGKIVVVGNNNGVIEARRLTSTGSLDSTFAGDGLATVGTTDYSGGANAVALQSDGKLVIGGEGQNNSRRLARLNGDGSLDSSFATGGVMLGAPSSGAVYSIGVQADGRIVTAGGAYFGAHFDVSRYTEDGALDSSFSSDGSQTTDFGIDATARAVLVQPDGKIVASGGSLAMTSLSAIGDFDVARYNIDGSPDPSFSDDGRQTTAFAGADAIYGVAAQPDGKLVAVGSAAGQLAIARYTSDGVPDSSFGQSGHVLVGGGRADAVAVMPDGKIVIAGSRIDANAISSEVELVRLTPAGTLDTSFSSDGTQITTLPNGFGVVSTLALGSDGKIVIGTSSPASTAPNFTVLRYNDDGALDTSFSGDGIQTTAFGEAGGEGVFGVAVQADGKVIAVGGSYYGSHFDVARYDIDGSPDTSFSTDGVLSTEVGANSYATSVVLRPNGQLLVGGGNGTFGSIQVNTYNQDGSPASESAPMTGSQTQAKALTLQPSGALLLVGTALGASAANDFVMTRYNPDGSIDQTLGSAGLLNTDFFGANDQSNSVTLTPDGDIVVAGMTTTEHGQDFALAKYDGGEPGLPTVPASTSPPQIAGSALVGSTLQATHGRWTNDPTSYSQQWRRCDVHGQSCSDIPGATATRYSPVAVDTGTTIVLRETASNAGGAGAPADSSATAPIQPAAAPDSGDAGPAGNGDEAAPGVPAPSGGPPSGLVTPPSGIPTAPIPARSTTKVVTVKAPSSTKAASLKKGVLITLSGLKTGSRVSLSIRLGTKALVTLKTKADPRGRATIRLKLSNRQLTKVRKVKKMELRFTLTTAGNSTKTVVKSLAVK